MKVIILCTQLEAGGAQRAAIRLCAELRDLGIEAENWFLYKKRDVFLDTPNLKLILPRNIESPLDYPRAILSYYRELKKFKPDAVISFMHYSNILGQTASMIGNVKIRVASHRNISSGDMNRFLMFLDGICARTGVYTSITAVSESTKRSYNYYSKKKYDQIKVIHNGMNFRPSSLTKEQARLKFNLPVDARIIGNIGRLSLQKNHKLLVEALVKMPGVHLIGIGEGELRGEIEEQARALGVSERIHLPGEISFNDIPDFLKALDMFVMPSLYEGLSNALVEALNAGLPILASDVDSQRDVIVDDNGVYAGILLPVHDADKWANSINDLFADPERIATMSETAIKRGKDFAMSKMVNGFLSTIQA
jgi:glycosyltransferase involved in cell wall biosynthesis